MLKFILALIVCLPLIAEDGLTISPQVIPLGKIPDIKKVDMTFEIQNKSSSSVVIEKVETSCGCSSATPSPQIVAAGGTSKVKVHLNPRGKKGYSSWQIKVFTNSVHSPILYASFEADVLQTGTVSHKFLSFGEFRRDKKQQKHLWISPQELANFKIISIKQNIFDQPQDCFDISVADSSYDGFYPGARPAKKITIASKKDIPYGRIDGELTIETDIPGYEKIQVGILARVAGDIGVRPDAISFGLLRSNTAKTRQVFVYHRNGSSFEIKNIKTPWKDLKVKTEVMIPNQYYKIIVTCKSSSSMKSGEIRDVMIVETSDKNQSQIKIPLQGYVMNPKKK